MRICVFGAGAVGGYLAAKLADARCDEISIVARGEHLAAIRDKGLTLLTPEGTSVRKFDSATDDPRTLPPQDIVFVTLKAHALPACAPAIRKLLGEQGMAVFATNGIPWWWNFQSEGADGGFSRVDVERRLWRELGPERVLGCVLYSMNEVCAPGVVIHRGNNRWILGEPLDCPSERLTRVVDLLKAAGINAESSLDLRLQIWRKLLRNIGMNPLCALTRLEAESVIAMPALVEIGRKLAQEVVSVAQAKGSDLSPFVEHDTRVLTQGTTLAGGAASPAPGAGTKPSMLQDVLANRPMEIEALLGQLQQFAREEGVSTPALDTVYALALGLNASAVSMDAQA